MSAMNTPPLPEGWALSDPTQMMHGQWYATVYHGRKMSLVLIRSDDGRWMAQNGKEWFSSATDAICHAVARAFSGD